LTRQSRSTDSVAACLARCAAAAFIRLEAASTLIPLGPDAVAGLVEKFGRRRATHAGGRWR